MVDLSKENMDALKEYLDEMIQSSKDFQTELDEMSQ